MALPKKNRLPRKSFSKKGKFFSSDHISFKEIKENPGKFSVVVSSRVVNVANKRNLLKRRIKEIIKKSKSQKSGILYAKKEIETLSFNDLEKEVSKLLKS